MIVARKDLFGTYDIDQPLTFGSLQPSLPLLLDNTSTMISGQVDLKTQVTNTLPVMSGGTGSGVSLVGNRHLQSVGQKIVEAPALSDGQLFMGSTGSAPVVGTITSGSSSIVVTPGAGTITVDTQQPITTISSPMFADMTVTGMTASKWVCTDANRKLVSQTLGGTPNQVILAGAPGSGATILSLPQDIDVKSSPAFISLTLSGLNASQPVRTDALKRLTNGNISLTSEVSNILPVANGGTNSSALLTNGKLMQSSGGAVVEGTDAANPSFTSVTASSLSVAMPVVTDGTKKLVSSPIALGTQISGVLPVANGGTSSSAALTNGKIMTSAGGAIVEGTSSTDPTFNTVYIDRSGLKNNKLVLWDTGTGSSTAFYGLGIQGGTLVYNVEVSIANHSFYYAGTNLTAQIGGSISSSTTPPTLGGIACALLRTGAISTTGAVTLNSLTASTYLGLDASKNVVSVVAPAALSLAAIGSTPNANGMTLSSNTLNLQPADATYGGIVTTGGQTFAGAKRFTANISQNISTGCGWVMGDIIGTTGFCGLQHQSLATGNPFSYALLQQSTGETFINTSSGYSINMRCNNSQIASFNAAGLILANSVANAGQSPLNYYEALPNQLAVFVGPPAAGITDNIPWALARIGNLVTYRINAVSVTSSTVASVFVTSAVLPGAGMSQIPARFRPPVNTTFKIVILNNGGLGEGSCIIDTAGNVTIGCNAAGTNFTVSSTVGWPAFSLSWLVT